MASTTTTLQTLAHNVTSEQIGKAHKILCNTGNFYLVENSRGDVDEDGNVIEYKVSSIRVNGRFYLTCTCKAGQNGHQCWHRRAAVACELELKAALAEQAAFQAQATQKVPAFYGEVNGKQLTKEEYDALMNRQPKPVKATRGTLQGTPAFSILR